MGDIRPKPASMNRRHRSPAHDQRRTSGGRIRYTADEWNLVRAAADAAGGQAVGAWVCQAALDAAVDRQHGRTVPRSKLDDLAAEIRSARAALVSIGGNVNQLAAVANSTGQLPAVEQLQAMLHFIRRHAQALDSASVDVVLYVRDPAEAARRRPRRTGDVDDTAAHDRPRRGLPPVTTARQPREKP